MAAISSNGTGGGDWSAGASWNGGVTPANGDSVIIIAGDTITCDVDLITAAIDLVGITINDGGYIVCSTATGTYTILCSADIVVNGEDGLQAGTSTSVPLPSDVTFRIDFDSTGSSIEGGNAGTIKLYCGEPTYKFIRLSGAEAAGQTELSVDTDVTGDSLWAAGAEVAIVDSVSSGGTKDVERRTIAAGGISSDHIDITVALTNDKYEGAYVVLLTRNIVIEGSTTYAFEDMEDGTAVYAFLDCAAGCYSCDNFTVGGSAYFTDGNCFYNNFGISNYDGTFVDDGLGSDRGIYNNYTVNTTSDTLFGGFYQGVYAGKNMTYNGVVVGCQEGFASPTGASINGDGWGCNKFINAGKNVYVYGNFVSPVDSSAIYGGNAIIVANNSFSCTRALEDSGSFITFYNTEFDVTEEFHGYDDATRAKSDYIESFDHDQTENAYKAWTRGGVVTSQTASPPTGYTIYYNILVEDDTQTYPSFRQYETTVLPGRAIEVDGYIKNAANGDLTGYEPALQIIDKFADPLVDSTASVLDEDTIPDPDSGSEAGWQEVSVIWANSGDTPRQVIVRMICYHDGGVDDVSIDTAWSIANYQDQIASIYEKIKRLGPTGQS